MLRGLHAADAAWAACAAIDVWAACSGCTMRLLRALRSLCGCTLRMLRGLHVADAARAARVAVAVWLHAAVAVWLHAAVAAWAAHSGSHDIEYNNAEFDFEPIGPSDLADTEGFALFLYSAVFFLFLQRNLRTT